MHLFKLRFSQHVCITLADCGNFARPAKRLHFVGLSGPLRAIVYSSSQPSGWFPNRFLRLLPNDFFVMTDLGLTNARTAA
jgi:hypothetical protein